MELTKEQTRLWRHRYSTKKTSKRVAPDGTVINFNLSYEEYLKIWIDSGHMDKCGRGSGKYCMSRYNDEGDYQVGNVFINQFVANIMEGRKNRKK